MNALERIIREVAPGWAMRRAQARQILAAYEAAKPSRLRKNPGETRSADASLLGGGTTLRAQARWLEENHDLVVGILDTLIARVVGRGIAIEPQAKNKAGELHEDFNQQLHDAFVDWMICPEVTGECDWYESQRLTARTWLRDGEVLAQIVEGHRSDLDHRTHVPFSLELLEPDFLPYDLNDDVKNIRQGVEKDAWGRPKAYHLYKIHPGDLNSYFTSRQDTKRVSADQMLHLKFTRRIRQTRGVSVLHSVLTRLEDIKDYEESERVAARVAAAMTAYIKKGTPDLYSGENDGSARSFKMAPGLVFDDLQIGEEIGTIESKRPSALLSPFRDAMMRAVSAGSGATYSSISKDYNGTYSAQRQELVEGYENYHILQDKFVSGFVRPVWRRFVPMAILSGFVKVPKDIDQMSIRDAEYLGPVMPWIDPDKESKSNERNARMGADSMTQIIRSRGGNPVNIRAQIEKERKWATERGIILTSDPAHEIAAQQEGNINEG